MEAVVEMPLCMMCLHSYINTITKNFPGASQVTMYMGRDVPTVIVYRIPGVDFIGYEPPAANHMYHRKRERAEVRNEGIVDSTSEDEIDIEDEEENETDSEDGDEDEMDLEDEDGDGEEVDRVIVINRKRVWSQMMDEDEMDPQDYGGDEMEQEDGDEDEMGPQDNGGDEMEQEDGNGDEDEMGPKNGAEDEMDAGDGDGDENGER
ncbi:uncharacterized protein LOC126803747 [Argentina anserina]|uniref:uncharacterized protein LOC126803747 n=1 Tax=Argentina anserina TaxID=57926 RepID=UPI002176825B|nr:uncharacterized protein LOC126803747 [Potentilla anserina]